MAVLSQEEKQLFTGNNIVASTYTYSTWVSTKTDCVVLQTELATLNATSLTYRLESRTPLGSRVASLYSDKLTAIDGIGKIHEISEECAEMRVGVKIDTVASPNNFYASLILTEKSK